MKKHKLAAFDLDGTLFDTRGVNFKAYQIALQEQGYDLDRNFYETECNGRYYKDYLPQLIPSPSAELMEAIHRRKMELYPTCLTEAKENHHLFALINLIRTEYYTALVTTASAQNCRDILNYFGREDLFDLVIAHNDVTRMKPDPEGYQKAISYFGVQPADTLVFEDSFTGLEAGRRAGAVVLQVGRF